MLTEEEPGLNPPLKLFLTLDMWIIHPYAAALFNAAIFGGIVLLMKSVDMASKRQLTLTRADAGSFALAVGFLYAAQQIKKHALKDHWVDQKYQQWSNQLASRICC